MENENKDWMDNDWRDPDCPIDFERTRQDGKTWIYGIYKSNGCCLYIGKTIDFRQRYATHKTVFQRDYPECCPIIMLPIELVDDERALGRERHHQLLLEQIGQAQISKGFWRTKKGKLKKANSIWWKESFALA